MPLYEYRCASCDHRFEVLQRLGDDGFARVMTTALSLMKKAGWR